MSLLGWSPNLAMASCPITVPAMLFFIFSTAAGACPMPVYFAVSLIHSRSHLGALIPCSLKSGTYVPASFPCKAESGISC